MTQLPFRKYNTTQFLVALGSNSPPEGVSAVSAVQTAISALETGKITVLAQSHLYQTPSFPAGHGPDYVNAAVLVEADMAAAEVLGALHAIESRFGRLRAERWGNRALDLDLLGCGDVVLPDEAGFRAWQNMPLEEQMVRAPDQLILPHPRLHERAFVLVPLNDIAPDWRHPVLDRTVADMLAALPQADISGITRL